MLTVRHVSKTYRDGTRALVNVDLDLPIGLYGLLGPNGAGKSTLMRMLATLHTPDTGQILFQGVDTRTQPRSLRERLGYLPQEFGVYPHISCRALLTHLAVLKGISDARARRDQVDRVLEIANLSAVAGRAVAKFSGGMRQRFGLAQALLGDPAVVILDEPTAGLDPAERLRLHDLLYAISRDRVVLLSTHIVEDVEHLCARTAILLGGCIVADGPTRTLFGELDGKVWQGHPDDAAAAADSLLLSRTLRHGEPVCRLYSANAPDGLERVRPTLQDRYFLHLHHRGVAVPA